MQRSFQTYVVCLQELEELKDKTAELLSCHFGGLHEVQAADVVSPESCLMLHPFIPFELLHHHHHHHQASPPTQPCV